MNIDAPAKALIEALNARHESGACTQFWLRDDDAVEPTGALDRLVDLTAHYAVPLTLAVIPERTGNALADHLNSAQHVDVVVHGWSHRNHAPQGEKKQELGSHRRQSTVVAELSRGFIHLQQLHGSRFVPVLVPPWNRIAPALIRDLNGIGFKGVSTFGLEKHELKNDTRPSREHMAREDNQSPSVAVMNTHVDLIDWKGSRGGRDRITLLNELVQLVRNGVDPIGFLTHHLVHDSPAWCFLEELFNLTAPQDGCRWVSIKTLLPDPRFPGQ